jgi:hypothetical protein
MNMDSLPGIISLDGSWDFAYRTNLGDDDPPAIPAREQFDTQMAVPGCWDDYIDIVKETQEWPLAHFNPDHKPIEFPMRAHFLRDSSSSFLVGVGWYKKQFEVADCSRGALATLCIGGVRLEAWVWLNGEFAGYHFGHSTPFEITLENVRYGEKNELTLAVANTSRKRLGCDLRGYKGFSGGIFRSVCLRLTGQIKMADLYLRPLDSRKQIEWNIRLQGEAATADLVIDWAIRKPDVKEDLQVGSVDVSGHTISWQTDAHDLQPWSVSQPLLYEVRVTLRRGDCVLDSACQNFGLRTIEREGTGLRLNGSPVYLCGLTEHCYFPLTCTPPGDLASYLAIIRKIKELGFNWIRFHTWVPSEEYMQAADKLGMLIQVEPPVGFAETEWVEILRACRKHPSVIIYCCGNEELLDEPKISMLRKFAELCRDHVPDALFNPQEALRGIEYVWTEAELGAEICEVPFTHNPARLDALREFSDVFGHYSWGYLSYVSSKGHWAGLTERMAVYQRPCLAHEMGIQGTYLDLALEKRYENTRIGTGLFARTREYIDKMGLLDKARLYYENSCAWQRIMRKQNIETARKCRTLAGYDFLGATDHHNHQCGFTGGIMNEFYELKPGNSAADTKKYNAQSVLLLDHGNDHNFRPGQHCQFDLMVSLFGPEPLTEGVVKWTLTGGDEDFDQGEICVDSIPNGRVATVGNIKFLTPPVTKGVKVSLRTELTGPGYSLENDWDFWVFPEAIDGDICEVLPLTVGRAENDVHIVSDIETSEIERLEKGETVVLLGTGPFPALPAGFQIGLPGRTSGNLATVIYDHLLTEPFPHEGFCDWQFSAMLENSQAIVFNDLQIPFDPIIELASSFKLIYKQASLFELAVGKGKLLVCTLNLREADPAACYLSGLLLRYAKSEEFRPRNKISCDDLIRIQKTPFGPYGVDHTDMAFDPNAQM